MFSFSKLVPSNSFQSRAVHWSPEIQHHHYYQCHPCSQRLRSLSPPRRKRHIGKTLRAVFCIPIRSRQEYGTLSQEPNDDLLLGNLHIPTISSSEEQTRAPDGDKLPIFTRRRDWEAHQKTLKRRQEHSDGDPRRAARSRPLTHRKPSSFSVFKRIGASPERRIPGAWPSSYEINGIVEVSQGGDSGGPPRPPKIPIAELTIAGEASAPPIPPKVPIDLPHMTPMSFETVMEKNQDVFSDFSFVDALPNVPGAERSGKRHKNVKSTWYGFTNSDQKHHKTRPKPGDERHVLVFQEHITSASSREQANAEAKRHSAFIPYRWKKALQRDQKQGETDHYSGNHQRRQQHLDNGRFSMSNHRRHRRRHRHRHRRKYQDTQQEAYYHAAHVSTTAPIVLVDIGNNVYLMETHS